MFAAGSSLAEKKKAAARAEQWLRRGGSVDWQVIFLSSDRSDIGPGTISFNGCLCDRIDRVRNIFLTSWQKAGLSPKNVWLISIDTWEVNDEGIPVNELGRYHMELDSMGYVRNAYLDDPVFSVMDIDKIGSIWKGPFDLAGKPDDEGIGEVGGEIKAAVEELFDLARKRLEQTITSKKESIAKYTNDEGSRFLETEKLDALQRDFTDQLDQRLKMKEVAWLAAKPNPFIIILEKLLSSTYSAVAASVETGKEVICIRYPAAEWHRECQEVNSQRRQLLKLTYFLICLVEKGIDVRACKRNTRSLWRVDDVIIDFHQLEGITQQTIKTWRGAAGQLEKEIQDQALVSSLTLLVPPPKQCPAQFEELRPDKIRGINTGEDWNQWLNNQQRLLDNDVKTAELTLAVCRGRLREAVGREPHNDVNVAVMIDVLGREAKILREEIRSKTYAQVTHGWPACVEELSRKVITILASTPSLLQKSLLLAVAGFVLLASYLVTACKDDGWSALQEPRVFLPAAILAGIVFLAYFGLELHRTWRKASLLKKIFKERKAQAENLKKMMTEHAEYLWKISHLAVVTQNLQILASAKVVVDELIEKKRYFLAALRGYDDRLQRYAGTAPNNGLVRDTTFEIEVDRPEELQKIFALIGGQQVAYQFCPDGTQHAWESSLLPGLRTIRLSSESSGQCGM